MRDFIVDAATYLVGRAIPALVGFLAVAVFVRTMGERSYGIYSIVFSGTNLASTVSVGWLSQAILRFQSRPDQQAERFSEVVAVGAICACTGAVIGTTALLLLTDETLGAAIIGAACLLVVGLTVHTAYTASLQAALRPRAVAALEILRAVGALPAGVLGIFTIHPPYVGATLGTGISYLISGAWARSLAARSMPRSERNSQGEGVGAGVRGLLLFGWPISLWFGVSLLFPFAERSLIQRFLGPTVTGQYAAIYDVVYRSCGFALLPIALAIHPRIMRAHALGNEAESRRLWRVGLVFQLLVSVSVTLVVSMAGVWIIAMTGVHSSGMNVALVLPLAAAGCVWNIALVSHKLLETRRQTHRMLAFLVAAFVVDMAIDISALPRFGPVAAAYALLATGMLYTICVGVDGLRIARSHA